MNRLTYEERNDATAIDGSVLGSGNPGQLAEGRQHVAEVDEIAEHAARGRRARPTRDEGDVIPRIGHAALAAGDRDVTHLRLDAARRAVVAGEEQESPFPQPEAIESRQGEWFAMGTQFHPEASTASALDLRIFEEFLMGVKEHADPVRLVA